MAEGKNERGNQSEKRITEGILSGSPESSSIRSRRSFQQQLEDLARFPQENPDPVLRVGKDGSILFANAACSLMDLPQCMPGQVIPEQYRQIVADVLGTGMQQVIEAEGQERTFSLAFVPVTDAGYVNIYGSDITERKRAEEALRESEEKFRIVSEFTYDWVSWRSPDNRFNYVSPSCENLTGYADTEFMDDPELYLRIIHPDDRERVETHLREEMHRHEQVELEFRIIRRDGQERWISHACRAIVDADDNFLGRHGANRDITERKLMEETLREMERDLNHAQEVAHIGSWRLDVRRNELLWSGESHRIFGIPPGTPMTYETFLSCVHPDDREYVDGNWQAALQGEEYDIEHRIIVGSEVKWVREKAELEFDDQGILKGGFGTVQDITELKKIEKIKDEFISLVSHELRTPLTIITGSLRSAMYPGVSPEDSRELIRNAADSADSLAVILENMLELSRYQANRLQFNVDLVDVRDVVNSVIDKLKDQGAGQSFTAKMPKRLPPIVADPIRVERILYNLVENATKYSPAKSEILVTVKRQGDVLITGVTDRGPGISLEDQERLFGLFEQLGERREPNRGLGIGLVVCKRLVEAMGGWIKAESQLGKGSTFTFALPANKPKVR